MKMKRKILLAGLTLMSLALGVIFTGCEKETEKETDTKFRISFVAGTRNTTPLLKLAANSSLVFNSGYVVIREIVFDGDRTDGTSISITHEQISTFDMFTGNSNPLVEVIIPPGTYNSVNLGVEIQDEDDRPSVVALGVFTNSAGQQFPLRFEFNSGEVFEANAEAFTFAEGTSALAQIDFSPGEWFSTITHTMLNDDERTNGVILISENTNSDIFGIVADKLDDATDATFR